jgi:ribosomal protein S18 acetylase RimI-like enzyme
MKDTSIKIEIVNAQSMTEEVASLFREYQEYLGVDLCFQNFEEELESLPGKYALPSGRLYISLVDNELAGCIALRKIDEKICEMKRLFVRTRYRNHGLGKRMVKQIISDAKDEGYSAMLLDTLPTSSEAISLYRSFGFIDIPPYYDNPHRGTVYMKLEL